MFKSLAKKLFRLTDPFLVLLVYPAAVLMRYLRWAGVQRLPLCKRALLQVGVFPLRNHYYDPQFDFRSASRRFSDPRALPGIDWNLAGQLALLERMTYARELVDQPSLPGDLQFSFDQKAFTVGDAEYWYQLIRLMKPRRIIEVGSGHSTLMAMRAVARNRADDPRYACEHVCIEPYEMPWLERTGVTIVRRKVEELEPGFFAKLGDGDILFIDSSHMIRPDGDVVFEYLQLLPTLGKGVIVHVHDIFSPRNYPDFWLRESVTFWNEQYLLEAFLTHNSAWKVMGALNHLRHDHYDALKRVCPFLDPGREPGSFYLQRSVD